MIIIPIMHIRTPIGNIEEMAEVYTTTFSTFAYLRAMSIGCPSNNSFASD